MSYSKSNSRPLITNCHFNSNYSPKSDVSISFTGQIDYTKQEFKEECDINTLMAKYQSTGEMPCINQTAPQYLDVSAIDYQECMEFVAGAQSLFNELPSSLRNRFDNSPAQFLDFTSNPENYAEMSKLGLLKPEHERVHRSPASASQPPVVQAFADSNGVPTPTPSPASQTP
ncbi:MAG: internal scaffolding protein [Microviridae sp.]|nr:MAG: internal scaffolding protein [Microviridae sp.]